MPKREDEYWAGKKEPKGRALCPFCGSSNIYYNKRYESWKCTKCEKSFPTPSYGPGDDFGKEARWFGKTTKDELRNYDRYMTPEETTKASERYAEKVKKKASGRAHQKLSEDKGHKWKKRRSSISWTAMPFILLTFLGLAIIAYTLSNSSIIGDAALIGIISAAAIITIWNISKVSWLWKYRPRRTALRGIFLSLLLLAITGGSAAAFSGVEPFSEVKERAEDYFIVAKDAVVEFFTNLSPPVTTTAPPLPATTTSPPSTSPPSTTEYLPIPSQEQLIEYALELINKDRLANGLDTVTLGSNIAAQKHAEEMLAKDYLSHWGIDGMKPYMRYTLAGGFNYEAENAFMTRTIWLGGENPSYQIDPIEVLEEAEESLMNSSGHRRNILNKWHKKVNLGIAFDNERLALVQQFEGDYITFNEVPVFSGDSLSLTGNAITGFVIDQIQIWYDQPPYPLTLGQLGATYAYNLGTPAAFIRPPPPPGSYYPTSETFFSWTTYVDPYSIPADMPPPTYTPFGIKPVPPLLGRVATVKWIDAKHWDVSGTAFNIDVNLNEIISKYGEGVYTVVIWATTGGESVGLTNYSIFLQ